MSVAPKVEHPRCPFCHEQVGPSDEQLACNGCRAWHHQACWGEGEGRCAACGSTRSGASEAELRQGMARLYWRVCQVVGILGGAATGGAFVLLFEQHRVVGYAAFLLGTIFWGVLAGLILNKLAGFRIDRALAEELGELFEDDAEALESGARRDHADRDPDDPAPVEQTPGEKAPPPKRVRE